MFLKRDTKVFLKKGTAIWEIPVMSGFSFSQGNTTSEVVLKEMATAAGVSRRGRRVFNDALAPADWSFSTYIRPFKAPAYTPITAGGTALTIGTAYKIITSSTADWSNVGGSVTAAVGNYFIATSTGNVSVTGTVAPASLADTAANIHAVEEVLWAQFVGLGTYTPSTYTFLNFEAPNITDLDISFTGGNNISLGEFDLYFILGANYDNDANYDNTALDDVLVYKIANCIINQATVNFDVDGIAMIEWSGQGNLISKEPDFDARTAISQGVTATSNFIRNKLTALTMIAANTTTYPGSASVAAGSLTAGRRYRILTVGGSTWTNVGAASSTVGVAFTAIAGTPGGSGTAAPGYDITLTGGSIQFSNNATFLTPETLGVVNRPIGHIAGNKSVTGNFTAYIEEIAGNNGTSGKLLADSLADLTTITNSFDLTFIIGGSGNLPRFEITLPTAHIEIPKVQSDDIISLDIAFHGLPSTITGTNEAVLKYVGAVL